MSQSIEVLCPSCNERFQAPSTYRGKPVLCLHCKANITAIEAPPIITNTPPPIQNTVQSNTPNSKANDSLWKKVISFRFKDLSIMEIITLSIAVCYLSYSAIGALSKSSSKESKSREHKSNLSSNSNTRREPTPSHYPVVRFIKENAKDPSSIEIMGYTEPQKVKDGIYSIRVKYRGKNGFGGYSIEDKTFFLNYENGYWRVRPL
ncbi:MAG: hypothetical protein ACJAR1_002157 [Rubritalea sp.]|jgi:hypothetical protein